ncbi:acyltransferase family protein [Pseudaquabacterium rugosum]|uniref:Acyltransferase n=1 Tax=Pseudaquabacterium rugosum TaxID=2984194 RepID=A0ABU9B5T6_9BURK
MNAPAAAPVRLPWIDGLRAVCALYIVGFWHLMDYVPGWPGYHNAVTQRLTVGVLGLFVLLSGFLLGQGAVAPGWAGLRRFWVRRLWRIHPLYLLALLAFWAIGLIGLKGVAKAALGLSMLWGPPPPTLWFVTALLVYYAVAPWLMRALDLGRVAGLAAVALAGVVLAGLVFGGGHGDRRLLLYFPAFAAGLALARGGLSRPAGLVGAAAVGAAVGAVGGASRGSATVTRVAVAAACAAALGLSLADAALPETSLWSLPLATAWPVALVLAVRWAAAATGTGGVTDRPPGAAGWSGAAGAGRARPLQARHRLRRAVGAFWSAPVWAPLARASFAMYLFHRPVYELLSRYLSAAAVPDGWIGSPHGRLLLLAGLGLPLVTALAWALQRGYDGWLDGRRPPPAGRR